jgi:hypothetical protein
VLCDWRAPQQGHRVITTEQVSACDGIMMADNDSHKGNRPHVLLPTSIHLLVERINK